jgi:hypothetical protein
LHSFQGKKRDCLHENEWMDVYRENGQIIPVVDMKETVSFLRKIMAGG